MLDMFVITVGCILWCYLILLHHIKRSESSQYYADQIHSYGLSITIDYPVAGPCKVTISNSTNHMEFSSKNLNDVLKLTKEYVEANADKFKPPPVY